MKSIFDNGRFSKVEYLERTAEGIQTGEESIVIEDAIRGRSFASIMRQDGMFLVKLGIKDDCDFYEISAVMDFGMADMCQIDFILDNDEALCETLQEMGV